ncbi:unnamed protein product, partial [Allacma fusca]
DLTEDWIPELASSVLGPAFPNMAVGQDVQHSPVFKHYLLIRLKKNPGENPAEMLKKVKPRSFSCCPIRRFRIMSHHSNNRGRRKFRAGLLFKSICSSIWSTGGPYLWLCILSLNAILGWAVEERGSGIKSKAPGLAPRRFEL